MLPSTTPARVTATQNDGGTTPSSGNAGSAKFNPATRIDPNPDPGWVWGSDHTVDTDPMKKGWRCRVWTGGDNQTFILGQPGVKGMSSIRLLPADGWKGGRPARLNVAIYDDIEPKMFLARGEVAAVAVVNAVYHDIPMISGWGLKVIRLIEKARA